MRTQRGIFAVTCRMVAKLPGSIAPGVFFYRVGHLPANSSMMVLARRRDCGRTASLPIHLALTAAWAWLGPTGCVGSIGDQVDQALDDPPADVGPAAAVSPAGVPGPTAAACVEAPPGVSPLRRLTNDEHARTLALLLGDGTPLVTKLSEAEQGSPVVSAPWAEGAMNAAEELAARAVKKLGALVPCAPSSGEEACARKFIEAFGTRAYRRPLSSSEVTRLLAMFTLGRSGADFAHGIEVVVRTMLQSPHFLYRVELGGSEGSTAERVKLTPYEVASRLSYGLWGSMPDETLFVAAADGRLGKPDGMAEQARRLVADPRGHLSLRRFHERWLGLAALASPLTGALASKDRSVYKELDEALVDDMRKDVASFLDFVLAERNGRLEALLTAPIAFTNARLATLYGTPPPGAGLFARTNLDPTRRSGILTSAGFLAVHTKADDRAAIHRGVAVRESLLCAPPPAPPGDIPDTPEVVLDNGACKACHQLINPIGAGFAHYDGIGRWRSTEGGNPIDARGELIGTEDVDGEFRGVPTLARRLLGSRQVRDCVVTHFVEFVLGGVEDACAHRKVASAYVATGMDIRELAIAMTRTDSFGYRRPSPGETRP